MLSPSEFIAGPIGTATPLSLVIPRTKYETLFLIGSLNDEPYAVSLSENYHFQGFSSAGNDSHHGLIISNVGIEVDEGSAFDTQHAYAPLGTLIRKDSFIAIAIKNSGQFISGTTLVTLTGELPPSQGQVGFTRWSITVGSGLEKRILHSVDVNPEGNI